MKNEICVYSVKSTELESDYIDYMTMALLHRKDIKRVDVTRDEDSEPVTVLTVGMTPYGLTLGFKKAVKKKTHIHYVIEKG